MSLNDDNEKVITIAASTLILGCAIEQLDEKEKWQRNRKKRKCWVKDWLACRESMGAYHALVLEFSLNEHDEYHRFMRMDPETFKAQHGFIDVKQRRLHLAQEKLDYLTSELEKSNNGQAFELDQKSGGAMKKYNPEELKEDIANARERVDNLKREMLEASDEIRHQQEGMTKLERINQNLFENGPYKVEIVREKVNEMKEVREKLLLGEQEKIKILQDLLRRRDEYQVTGLSPFGCQIGGSTTSLNSSGSAGSVSGSPCTGSDENMVLGLSKRQLRKDYQLAIQRVHALHAALEMVDYRLEESENGPEQHRLMLYNEKQTYLSELERFIIYIRTEEERAQLEYEKELLIQDLLATREMSSKVIEDRMQLKNERKYLQQQLAEKTRQTNLLELKLKSLSASTLSVSSSSSRGSVSTGSRGSLSASSRGSLNSLCLHGDVNGNEHHASFCHIPSNTCPPIYEAHILATKAETTEGLATIAPLDYQSAYLSNSKLSLHSRDSNASPPTISSHMGEIQNENSDVGIHIGGSRDAHHNCDDGRYMSYSALPLTTYQCTMGSPNDLSNQFDRTVHNAVSNESVATDSGVFEASNELRKKSVTRQDSGHSSGVYCGDDNIETAQIRIRLEYKDVEGKLILSIEKGRNIKALYPNPLRHILLKGSLLPTCGDERFRIKTRKCNNSDRPCFNEQFLFTIDRNKLLNKTLQLDLFGFVMETNREECLGCVQISLADFDYSQEIGLKWYNLLASSFANSTSLRRSVSSISLEAIQQRLNSLPSLLANAEEGVNFDRLSSTSLLEPGNEGRDRANSNEERRSHLSQRNNIGNNSLCNSSERLQMFCPSAMLQHLRSRSDEREEHPMDVNVGRSISDCTGCRRSIRNPFIRMGVGRRSIRQNRLAELKHQKLAPGLSSIPQKNDFCTSIPANRESFPLQQKRDSYPNHNNAGMTSLDLEMELQAAYSKQETLNEEIYRLKEIKKLMDERRMEGSEDLPQWLVENGDNFDALLDEAKKEVSSHLSGQTSFLEPNKKFTNLAKTNPKQANIVGFQDKMRFFTTNKCSIPANPEVHWV